MYNITYYIFTQIIKEQFVIGLISSELRTLKQINFHSSLLIAGPEKSGKTLLINAICTETGSLKIELDFKNLAENYPVVKKVDELVLKIITVMYFIAYEEQYYFTAISYIVCPSTSTCSN